MSLLVAVGLPAEERGAAWQAAEPLRRSRTPVRWVPETDLHITVQFLGDVPDGPVAAIGAALSAAVRHVKPFDLGLDGFGAFPDFAAPRVLWIGVERHPALELLTNDVAGALRPLGFEPELRPFQPHLTIGRLAGDAASVAGPDLETVAATLDYAGVIPVVGLDLMVSRRGPGLRYESLYRAELGGGR